MSFKEVVTEVDRMIASGEEVHTTMGIPDDIESELEGLLDDLKDIRTGVLLLKIVPNKAIKQLAKVMDQVLRQLETAVRKAEGQVEKIDDKIEPYRDELEEFIDQFSSMRDDLVRLQPALDTIVPDDFTRKLIEAIVEVRKMTDAVGGACAKVNTTYEDIKDVRKVLGKLGVVFEPIGALMNKKITVEYPSKVKVKVPVRKRKKDWKKPWKWVWKYFTVWEWKWTIETKKFSFTVEKILSGALSVIKPVEDLLNKAVDKVVDPVMDVVLKQVSKIVGADVSKALPNLLKIGMFATVEKKASAITDAFQLSALETASGLVMKMEGYFDEAEKQIAATAKRGGGALASAAKRARA